MTASSVNGAVTPVDHLIINAAEVVTCAGFSTSPARGARQGELGVIPRGAVATRGDTIVAIGPEAELRALHRVPEAGIIDAQDGVVLPGFVDSHTHLLFGGDRSGEWEARMAGKSYLDILRDGGGILSTVRATRAATRAELLDGGKKWARRALMMGTTTLEMKSGYCLDREGELKLLEVARDLSLETHQTCVSTYLGAHVVPEEFRARRGDYIALVLELLEVIRERSLAEFVDVFCETEAFSLSETRDILTRAQELGFGLKLHVEQFTAAGGTELGTQLGAVSVDHLEQAGDAEMATLKESGTLATLLPAVPFHLGMADRAPARGLIEAGVPVALATDFNPGSSFTPSMPMVIALAARTLGMSAAEAIMACTINAAHALRRGGIVGSLEPGKRADVIVCDVPDYRWLAYGFGWNPVSRVLLGGKLFS